MQQNIIIKGRNNPVRIQFSFKGDFQQQGLSSFSRVELTLGNESYNTLDNPTEIKILEQGFVLEINIGMATLLPNGSYMPEIVGYSNVYTDGYELTSRCKPVLGYIKIVSDC